MPEIIIVNSKQPQKITTIYITPEKILARECLIGRDESCCIVLPDSLVSRIHGKIIFQKGSYYYNDLGSRNGSRLNNQLLKINQNYPLNPSDALNLGSHLLWIKSVSEIKTNTVSFFPSQEYKPSKKTKPILTNCGNKGEITLRCVQIIPETYCVKTFRFVADPSMLFKYQPGQFLTFELESEGKTSKVCYYLSSSPSRPHTLDLTIKKYSSLDNEQHTTSNIVNNWLYDRLKIGSEVKVKSITGKFTCINNPAPKLLLISAGSGIIPLISMARWLCDTASEVDIIFCHSARSPQEIIFRTELELMAARYPNFKLAITITDSEPDLVWYGYTGQLSNAMLSIMAPDLEERNIYACGSNSFLTSIEFLLTEIDFPMQNYYQEYSGIPSTNQSCHSLAQSPVSVVNTTTLNSNTSLQQSKLDREQEQFFQFPSESGTLNFNSEKVGEKPALKLNSQSKHTGASISQSSQLRYHSLPPLAVVPTPFKPSTTEIIPFPSQPNSVATIHLTNSKQVFNCDRNKSILAAAIAEEIDLPHGCGIGVCGHCQVKKLAGDVTYDEDVDCKAGYILTCMAKPVGQVKLEV